MPLASGAEFLYYLPGPAPYSSKTISTLKLRRLRLGLQYPVMLSREGKLVHMNILAYLEIAALEISRGLKQVDASIRDIKETRNQHHKSHLLHPWLFIHCKEEKSQRGALHNHQWPFARARDHHGTPPASAVPRLQT
jgi:hypothetical protein